MAEQAAARSVCQLDAAELRPPDARDAVVPRQSLVEKRVVGRQQLDHAAILANLVLDEQLGFLPQRVAEVLVELGKRLRVGRDAAHVAQVEPLAGKIADERRGTRIGEHPFDLPPQHHGIRQPALFRERQQLVVGNRAPEKQRETRGELNIADAVERRGTSARRIAFDEEQEVGVDQQRAHGELDAAVEA